MASHNLNPVVSSSSSSSSLPLENADRTIAPKNKVHEEDCYSTPKVIHQNYNKRKRIEEEDKDEVEEDKDEEEEDNADEEDKDKEQIEDKDEKEDKDGEEEDKDEGEEEDKGEEQEEDKCEVQEEQVEDKHEEQEEDKEPISKSALVLAPALNQYIGVLEAKTCPDLFKIDYAHESSESFFNRFPFLKKSLESEHIVSIVDDAVEMGLSKIGEFKAQELEMKWIEVLKIEAEARLKRLILVEEQMKIIYKVMKQS